MTRKMIIRQRDDLAQIAVLEDDILVEHYVDRATHDFLDRQRLPRPRAERAAVHGGCVRRHRPRSQRGALRRRGRLGLLRRRRPESQGREGARSPGQTILVQVSKDPVGAKGARLTNHVSIPGRYIVYAPGGHLSGISRKLPDSERRRLKEILLRTSSASPPA